MMLWKIRKTRYKPVVMLADAETEFVVAATAVIEGLGYDVHNAKNTRAALAEANNGIVAAIIDPVLSHGEGAALVDAMRQTRGACFPLFICSRVPVDPAWSAARNVTVIVKGTVTLHDFASTLAANL